MLIFFSGDRAMESPTSSPAVPAESITASPTTAPDADLAETVFQSLDSGRTWHALPELPEVFFYSDSEEAESDGVVIRTSSEGIIRSTDQGKHWESVINEGGVGIAVERIDGGFAAISYSTSTGSRRIRISLDDGKTWEAIDQGLMPSLSISSIKQMGKYLLCGHPDGIFRSSDMEYFCL